MRLTQIIPYPRLYHVFHQREVNVAKVLLEELRDGANYMFVAPVVRKAIKSFDLS